MELRGISNTSSHLYKHTQLSKKKTKQNASAVSPITQTRIIVSQPISAINRAQGKEMTERQAKDGATNYDDKHIIRDRYWAENHIIINVFLNPLMKSMWI